jgi:hypothetical protein
MHPTRVVSLPALPTTAGSFSFSSRANTIICRAVLLGRLLVRRHVVAAAAAFHHMAVVALDSQRGRDALHRREDLLARSPLSE